jgi:hypothetical protein
MTGGGVVAQSERRATVLQLAPHWVATELQKVLGERALKACRDGDVDEMRRLTEAVQWLKTKVTVRDEVTVS